MERKFSCELLSARSAIVINQVNGFIKGQKVFVEKVGEALVYINGCPYDAANFAEDETCPLMKALSLVRKGAYIHEVAELVTKEPKAPANSGILIRISDDMFVDIGEKVLNAMPVGEVVTIGCASECTICGVVDGDDKQWRPFPQSVAQMFAIVYREAWNRWSVIDTTECGFDLSVSW